MVRAIWLARATAVAVLICVVGSAKPSAAADLRQAAEVVGVETVDGRALRGVVDARTDGKTLWLRQEEDGIVLSVPVSWNTISSAVIRDEAIGLGELRERFGELRSEGPRWLIPEVKIPGVAGSAKLNADVQAGYWEGLGRGVRVRNLDVVSACLVNLDRDMAPDGIEVSIVAVGDDGAPVAVRGSLRAELFGESGALSRDRQPEFGVLDRWSERVRAEDFVDGVATYCLPFRRAAPEWQFDLLPDAVLTVQLGATGHGNFSATAPVVLREFNPLRDDLQQHRGTRFFPNEVQGWRPQDPFGAELGRWQWWGR
jgi:hypothetical protein